MEKLRAEVARLRRHDDKATITPSPGGTPVEVGPGDELEIMYKGECRLVRVMSVAAWGVRCWDVAKSAVRAFKFEKIGAAGEELPAS